MKYLFANPLVVNSGCDKLSTQGLQVIDTQLTKKSLCVLDSITHPMGALGGKNIGVPNEFFAL